MTDNKNFILAIILSSLIIFAWQYFYAAPQIEEQKRSQEPAQQTEQGQAPAPEQRQGTAQPGVMPQPPGTAQSSQAQPREQVVEASARVAIDTPSLSGSVNLKGAQFDDLHLKRYRETVDPHSSTITLLSPLGSAKPYFAENGWTAAGGTSVKLPDAQTVWSVEGNAKLTPQSPVHLTYDNGQGVIFHKRIAVDEDYMFTVTQEVENNGGQALTLYPYSRVVRVGEPETANFYILHEGLLGVLGGALQEVDYDDLKEEQRSISHASVGGWLGITDKYWAVALVPGRSMAIEGSFRNQQQGTKDNFQADYIAKEGVVVPASGRATSEDRIFAGAKVVKIVDSYWNKLGIDRFDLMIDWGWFRFLTKPLFSILEFFYQLVGNFGIAILIVTVLIKAVFFPLANKSYESMSKMKKLQPEMERLKQLYPDDRMKQQQELMALYKKEKVSPLSGCLPILLQIPVFFALYKVLFVTIEMRHAPFYGWIRDLSAPDPTSLFNLFGLIPWDPPALLHVGLWPIIMGITMWMQMRLNPTPPDPIQAKLFNWMPLIFTFMLASFPAGLVIYWAWNNSLSILQQAVIMKRNGVEVDFIGNVRSSLPFLNRPSSTHGRQPGE
jgi:YidC/Oxa1 family membrane protein insertase